MTVGTGCAAETHLPKLDQPCDCDSWRPDLHPALQANPLQPDFKGQVTVLPGCCRVVCDAGVHHELSPGLIPAASRAQIQRSRAPVVVLPALKTVPSITDRPGNVQQPDSLVQAVLYGLHRQARDTACMAAALQRGWQVT